MDKLIFLRNKLNNEVANNFNELTKKEIVEISQELDKLIVNAQKKLIGGGTNNGAN